MLRMTRVEGFDSETTMHLPLVILTGIVLALPPAGGIYAQSASPPGETEMLIDAALPLQDLEMSMEEADRFVNHIFSELEVTRYDTAAQFYLWMLDQLDQPFSEAEQPILRRHLRLLAMIIPASERAELGLDAILEKTDLATPAPGFGAQLVQWWRRQDPLPATTHNERLEEYLTRVAFASHKYQDEEDDRGFDDRGEIYVRLGNPSRSKTIAIRTTTLLTHPLVSTLPDNEFWVYKHVDYDAHYVFLRRSKNKPFKLGYPTDLIPTDLRNGRRKTPLLLGVLEEVYAQLALEHGSYGKHYDEVANYLTLPPPNAHPPHLFAQRVIERAFVEDQQHEWTRQQTVPASFSNTLGEAGSLDVPVRWARFLDADGSTRTEFYWGLEARALKPGRRLVRRLKKQGNQPSEKYLISMAVAQRTADYQYRHIDQKHYLIPTGTIGTLPPKTFVARGDTAMYHLALQWDQQWTRTNEENPGALLPGATLKVRTHRVDSMQALHSRGHRLEMSDLKPLHLASDLAVENASPYPYALLTPETPLALYFELYHLTFGSDDQTHYTVEYSVTLKKKRGLLPRRTPREAERVGAKSSYTGDSRIAREYIVLDLSTWQQKGEIELTLRATDETTGDEIGRTITFDFEP